MKGLREFLSQNGPGRWGFALTLLLVIFGDCGALDFARRSYGAKSCCAADWSQRRALDGD